MQTARAGLVTAIKSGSATNVSAAVNALTSIQGAEQTCRATAAAGIYADLNSNATGETRKRSWSIDGQSKASSRRGHSILYQGSACRSGGASREVIDSVEKPSGH